MQGSVMLGAGRRSEELRYVTQHFQDLQGLRWAPLCASIALSSWVKMAHLSDVATLGVLVFSVAVCVATPIVAKRWYRDRYGLVVSSGSPGVSPPWWRGQLVLLVGGLAIAAWSLYPHEHVLLLAGSVLSTLIAPRCVDPVPGIGRLVLRRVLYTAALLLITTMGLRVWFERPNPCVRSDTLVVWQSASFALLIVSLYDHWLLETVLRGDSRGVGVASEG